MCNQCVTYLVTESVTVFENKVPKMYDHSKEKPNYVKNLHLLHLCTYISLLYFYNDVTR